MKPCGTEIKCGQVMGNKEPNWSGLHLTVLECLLQTIKFGYPVSECS